MTRPLFSIAIPTFNYGRFLRRAVDSVLAQPGDDFELIVADDGSTDDTPLVAASYGSRLRYVRQERLGVYEACRRAFDASQGRFLIFFDADDALRPEALAILRRAIERRPDLGLVAGRHVNVAATGRRESPRIRFHSQRTANFRDFLLGRQFLCTGAAAIRREAVELVRQYDGSLRVGMETACFAQTLWFYDAAAVDDVLLEVHDHPDRLRNNLSEIRLAGEALVDAVFDPAVLPPEAMHYRDSFRARLLRDRARSYHKGGFDAEAVRFFREAMRCDPVRTLGDVRNLRRYLVSRARQRFVAPTTRVIGGRPSREAGVVEATGREPMWGHRRQMNADAIGLLRRCSKLGGVVKLQLARPTYLLSDSRDILHVFVQQPARYRRTGVQAAFRPLFGRGLFTRTGRSHIEQRRAIQPLLHRKRMDVFLPAIRKTLDEIVPHWTVGQTLEANGTMTTITLKAAGRIVLGLEREEDGAELFEAIHGSHQRVVRNMRSTIPGASWLPSRRNRNVHGYIRRIDALTQRLIDEARASERGDSLLAQMVRLRDDAGKRLDDRTIRDHAMTLYLAAYEPTATSLTWILHLLARHPEVQQRLQAEIDEHARVPRAASQSGDVGEAGELCARPYLSQVISEAVRLYPSTWLTSRRAIDGDQLPSGARIPSDADVFASPLLVHRDPQRYDEPDQFRPERFSKGIADHRAAGNYFPFGLGPAACLGEYLARLMMAATVEAIVARFHLATSGQEAPQMYSTNQFTMQPDRAIRLRLEARKHAAYSQIKNAAA